MTFAIVAEIAALLAAGCGGRAADGQHSLVDGGGGNDATTSRDAPSNDGSSSGSTGGSSGSTGSGSGGGASSSGSTGSSSGGGSSGEAGSGSSGGGPPLPGARCTAAAPCNDFPATPILDPAGKPSGDPSSLFGAAGAGTTQNGPCLFEPAHGALYPKNWLRPRVYWKAGAASQNLFEVRLHSDGEANDLRVYTTNTYWAIDSSIWQTIAWVPPGPGGTSVAKDGSLIGAPISVTVRAINSGGGTPSISNTATITIAPAIADGALVYWTAAGFDNSATSTTLQGFHVGDEGSTTALTSSQVQQPVRALPLSGNLTGNFQQVFCIGCHAATPDGNYVAFTAQWPWPNALASIQAASQGATPPWMSKGAVQNLSPDYRGNPYDTWYEPPAINQIMLGSGTFSPAHYATGDRMYIATLGSSWTTLSLTDPGVASGVTSQLAWFNLEWDNATTAAGGVLDSGLPAATPCTQQGSYPGIMGSPQPCLPAPTPNGGWGTIARNGDSNGAGAPSWSHNLDGNTDYIAYASTNVGVKDGHMDCSASASCFSDVFFVPYGSNGPGLGGKGGAAKGLPGAFDPLFNEYYPAWSPDDKIIAFDRVPAGTSMYDEPKADVYVVPFNGGAGGAAQPLVSNTPVSCTGAAAGTVQNTWPQWAPNLRNATTQKPVPQTDTNGNTYYWIAFSSTRAPQAPPDPTNGNKRRQQLYVAGVVVSGDGTTITSYAPIYLWNQDYTVNNLLPAWGEFAIPPGSKLPPIPPAL